MATNQIAGSIGNTVGIRGTLTQVNRPKFPLTQASTNVTGSGQVFPTGR